MHSPSFILSEYEKIQPSEGHAFAVRAIAKRTGLTVEAVEGLFLDALFGMVETEPVSA